MNNRTKSLPMEIIREALELDPTSPTWLRWRTRPRHHFKSDRGWKIANARFAGNIAGDKFITQDGRVYFRVGIAYKRCLAHRVVYALANGIDPSSLHIDHQDGNTLNNNPVNLRTATNAENMMNRGKTRRNTSGRKGVFWHEQGQKWHARIRFNNQRKYLGCFTDINEAAAAYQSAARQLHGNFFHQPQTTQE